MADVNERAQLIVVVALVVAVLFIALALVVNSAIYTENVATRDSGAEPRDTLEERQSIERALGEQVDRTNARYSTTDSSFLVNELQRAIGDESVANTGLKATKGSSVGYSVTDVRDGTRLRQTDETRNFESRDGETDWLVTQDVPDGGQFAMQFQRDSLFEATLDTTMAVLADSAFAIEFHEDDYTGTGDGIWRIYVFQGVLTNSVYAIVETPEQEFADEGLEDVTNPDHIVDGWLDQSCSMQGETVSMELSTATFGGSHCDELEFYGELDAHSVEFTNVQTGGTDRARGTYDIFLEEASYDTSAFYDAGDGQPFHQSGVYSLEYELTYQTGGTTYATSERTLYPQRRDPGGILWEHPRITEFTVTDTSTAGTAQFDVDWAVSDPDGKLERVELTMVDRTVKATEEELEDELEALVDALDLFNGDEIGDVISVPVNTNDVVDKTTISVDGYDASGTHTLSHDDGIGTEYRIQITVVDESGHTTTMYEKHEAGGG